jgi:hypothetical protein
MTISKKNRPCPCGSGKKYKKGCLQKSEKELHYEKDYFIIKGKTAEKIVHDLAVKTFFTDWCYMNPKLPDGKELCDLLVIFDDTAIIWQIKDLKLDTSGKYKKAEVDKNLRQLSGARRQLFDLKTPIELENPRRVREVFDPTKITEIYLLSVLLGEGEEVSAFVDEIRNHTVHILDREFTQILLSELDTISDFTTYLRSKEAFLKKEMSLTIMGGEEELLAYYLMHDRSFMKLEKATSIVIESGSWLNLQNNLKYLAKKKEDAISYGWDDIINRVHEGSSQYEIMARELARPNRFQRRYLSKVYYDAFIQAHNDNKGDLFRRILFSDETTYCFLFQDERFPREKRKEMLMAICFFARGKHQKNSRVIGIATEKKIQKLCSYDFYFLNIPEWTTELQSKVEKLQSEMELFVNPTVDYTTEMEYPESSP